MSQEGGALARLFLDREGPLTRELLRRPGGFGLGQVPARAVPDATVPMVCGYCSTGCSLDVHVKDGRPVNLSPTRDYSVNRGMACPKGWEALAPLHASDRATRPLVRDEQGKLRPVSWSDALGTFATRLARLQAKHGPAAMAFLSTGQIPTEEMALLGMVAKFGLGMTHGDGNTRQCMATSVVAYKQAFGFDAPPYTYADLEESDVLVFVGANPAIAHPILWERVLRNRRSPDIVVVDPRQTETSMSATLHVPIAPKSDLTLLYGIARLVIEQGAIDRAFVEAHTEGFEALRQHVQAFDIPRVERETRLPRETIERLAALVGSGRRVSFWWTMGVNQSHEGVLVAQALIALALLTGNVGKPGTGANSITGQCNAMGSRLFSNTTNLLGGHDFTVAAHREKIAGLVGIPVERIPDQPSLAYDQILEGIHRGRIRGLWVVATNTAHSWINQRDARELLGQLELLVVQDMYHSTETAQAAHVLLPAAGWGEKEGTFINSERRISLVKRVSPAPGEALADFHIFRLVAEATGCAEPFRRFEQPEDVFHLLREVSRGQPCDITGIRGYAHLAEAGGIQWPLPEGTEVLRGAERRLFADGRFCHPDGKARFCFGATRPPGEQPSAAYPLRLLTGRGSSAQWHTQTRTAKSELLRQLYPEQPYVEVHPEDARSLGIRPGQWVAVESARGTMRAKAFVTPTVQIGQVFVPMHYEGTNRLTFAEFDAMSRQPSYKSCAVRLSTDPVVVDGAA